MCGCGCGGGGGGGQSQIFSDNIRCGAGFGGITVFITVYYIEYIEILMDLTPLNKAHAALSLLQRPLSTELTELQNMETVSHKYSVISKLFSWPSFYEKDLNKFWQKKKTLQI